MMGNLFENETTSAKGGWVTAHCDGGSRGNPGPAGFGAVITGPDGQVLARLSQFLGVQTNNFAEYSGLLAVLKWALERRQPRLRVVSDSELMVKQMKGQYKVASPGLRPLWEEARGLARQFQAFEITHTLRGGNKEADRLANEAMDKGMGKPSPSRTPGNSGGSGVGGASGARANAYEKPPARPGATPPRPPRQVLDGFVRDGVVHLLEGELPEGTLVKVILEPS
jgi:probable phosphoglycerate mutase